MTSKELVAAALEHPYPSPGDLAEAFAKECAVSNIGMSLHDYVSPPRKGSTPDLAKVVPGAFSRCYQQSESDSDAECLEAERTSFLKPARQAARAVRDAKLPLTLANARKAYYGQAPFTKDTVK
jgi:hypothetical protein